MSTVYTRTIPTLLLSALITAFLVAHFLPGLTPLIAAKNELNVWASILGFIASVYAVFVMLLGHLRSVKGKMSAGMRTLDDITVWLSFIVASVIYLYFGASSSQQTTVSTTVNRMSEAINGVAAFFMLLYGYRRLRFKTAWQWGLAIGSLTWLASVTPLFTALAPSLLTVNNWVNITLVSAGSRAAIAVVGISAIIVALRAMIGIERILVGRGEQ